MVKSLKHDVRPFNQQIKLREVTHRKTAAMYEMGGHPEIDRLLSRNTTTSERQVRTIAVNDRI